MQKIFIGYILISTIVASAIPVPLSSLGSLSKRNALPSDLDKLNAILNHCAPDRTSLTNFDFNFPQFNSFGVCPPSNNHNIVPGLGNQGSSIPGLGGSTTSVPGLGGSTASVPGLGG